MEAMTLCKGYDLAQLFSDLSRQITLINKLGI